MLAQRLTQYFVILPSPPHTYQSLESLLPLAGLTHLKSLTLHLPGTKLTNPVCSNPAYKTFMSDTFPLLSWLDGEKITGPGSELYTSYRKQQENGSVNGSEDSGRRSDPEKLTVGMLGVI